MLEKLTVGVPVHNEEKSIEITLDSILDQELPDNISLEIIVCDNGSTDRTREIVRVYMARHPEANIRLITLEEASKSKAWNRIVKEADTEYIIFCDSDVVFSQDAFKRLYLMAKANHDKKAISGHSVAIHRTDLNVWEKIGLIPREINCGIGLCGGLYIIKANEAKKIVLPEDITDDIYLGTTLGFEHIRRCFDAKVYDAVVNSLRDYFLQRVRVRVHDLNIKIKYKLKVDRSRGEKLHVPKGDSVLPFLEERYIDLVGRLTRVIAKAYAYYRFRRGINTWDNIPSTKIGDLFNSYHEAKAYIQAHHL